MPQKTVQKIKLKEFIECNERLAVQVRNMNDDITAGVFDNEHNMIGQELEIALFDKEAKPAIGINKKILNKFTGAAKKDIYSELGSWNLEIRTKPKPLEPGAFYEEEKEMLGLLSNIREKAKGFGVRVGLTGTAETLTDEMLHRPNAMTDSEKYLWLEKMILEYRKEFVYLDIDGPGGKKCKRENITVLYESSATSSQQHLQVRNTKNIPFYLNASMILAAPLMAIAANSPFVLGDGPYWDESRIVIFEQTTDTRNSIRRQMNYPKRCGLGSFLYSDPRDFFNTISILYDPIYSPNIQKVSNKETERRNKQLLDLRLIGKSVWWWVRPVIEYQPLSIRIENRNMSAGPTVRDNMANSVLYWGAVYALVNKSHPIKKESKFPFKKVKENFYNAAKYGNEADLYWISEAGKLIRDKPFNIIQDHILPSTEWALDLFEITTKERNMYLDVIKKRLKKEMSPAKWKIKRFTELCDKGKEPYEALQQIVEEYIKAGESNTPLIR